ncbi:MAG TPA: O-antigen ligase family protein [Solirubrobacterales bacterium]|nr:O-antigen ligase family protein [Solirubrobacterales bacterium]
MTATALELTGMLAACGSAALAVAAADRRLRLAAVAAAVVVAPILVAGDVWDEPRVVVFREDTAQVVGAIAATLVVVGVVAFLVVRVPDAFPVLAIGLLPLRVPVEIGGETANLLIPLYAVIAATAAVRIRAAIVDRRSAPPRTEGIGIRLVSPRAGLSSALRWLLAATLLLYAAQSAYSRDVSTAIEYAGFFLVPFAVMFALLLEVEWTRRLLGRVLIAVAAMASVFAAIAVYQYLARDLFLNDELLEANQLHQYFRVNSLFFDPNILGRYLALAVTAVGAYIASAPDRRTLGLATAAAGLALCGIAFSFSISSIAALAGGLGVVATIRWRLRGAIAAAAIGAAAVVLLAALGGAPSSDVVEERDIYGGRTDLVEGGLELAEKRPLAGWGSGSFGVAYWEQIEQAQMTISHAEPVTVAAEQGALGVAVYLPLVVVSLLVLLSRRPGASAARTAVAGCYVAMLIHSLGYAGFAIDPATWALLALGVALRE